MVNLPVTKRIVNGFEVGAEPVSGQLDRTGHTGCQIFHEHNAGVVGAVTYPPCRHELRILADRNPCPHVTRFGILRVRFFLGVHKAPDFVSLNPATFQIAESLVLVIGRMPVRR